MRLSSRGVVARAESIARQEARRQRRKLEQELGDYRSASDLLDLEAMLDRHPDGATAEIREILFRQKQTRATRRNPWSRDQGS